MALFGDATVADPYRVFGELRERDPVHWSDEVDAWVLTRFADVRAVLHDQRFSSRVLDATPHASAAGPSGPAAGTRTSRVLAGAYTFVNNSLVFSDPPQHTRLRRLVGQAFVPAAVDALAPAVEHHTRRLLDAAGPRFDVVADLAEPLPIAVLGELLGVPLLDGDAHRLKTACDDFLLPWGRDVSSLSEDENDRAVAASGALGAFVETVLTQRGDAAPDDVVGRLLAGETDEQLTHEELFATIVLLLIAGHENLTSMLGNGVLWLLDLPELRARLRDEPDRWAAVTDELLRLITPNQFIRRVAREDVTLGGRSIRAGDATVLVLAAANRDPQHFPDPDQFVLDRTERRDVALGQGPHYCLGAPLARLETRIALRELLERHPSLTIAGPPSYAANLNLRLLTALPVSSSPE
ncbi:cytochrome P450 [Actinomycetospora sp. CA-101289]|uniref:cytochrome P450 n=1 Tax=Actinomycetospora sp. CA-101289 TaxID=3239893 RepID=UPI003D95D6FA